MSDAEPGPDREAARRLARLRAMAVRVDSQPALLAAARRIRRKLPGDPQFGDPLSTAGREPVAVVARGVSVLRPQARESLGHELGLSALQLWQSVSERAGRGRGDRPLAILFTDLVGFSSWALDTGDANALELLRKVGCAVEDAIEAHEGRVVKRLGDGVMAVFDDAPAGRAGWAVTCSAST